MALIPDLLEIVKGYAEPSAAHRHLMAQVRTISCSSLDYPDNAFSYIRWPVGGHMREYSYMMWKGDLGSSRTMWRDLWQVLSYRWYEHGLRAHV